MKRVEPGWVVLTLAGLAALLGSFLPFYTYTAGVDVTVWSRGLFPTAALIPLLGLVIGLQALFVLVAGREPRSPFLNFTWMQVRLAAGAFMILLALSYLLQDRAGGSLGSGYLVLSLASLVTFAGGVLTRRAQLARTDEEAPARKRQVQLKPAIASVNRLGAGLARNVVAFGHSAAKGTAALGRNAARSSAALGRNVGAHLGFGEPNDAKQHGATLDAKLYGKLDVQPPPPPPGTLVEKLPEEPVETTAYEPVETTADEPVEATAEKPVEATVEKPDEEIATEPARGATVSAVPPEAEPDKSAAPDGDASPPARESPDGSDKVAASKPKSRRQPARKVEKKAPVGDSKEPQSPAPPG